MVKVIAEQREVQIPQFSIYVGTHGAGNDSRQNGNQGAQDEPACHLSRGDGRSPRLRAGQAEVFRLNITMISVILCPPARQTDQMCFLGEPATSLSIASLVTMV